MRRPRAICFDMGYTLLRHVPNGPALYQGVLAELGHEFALEVVDRAHAPARELYVRATREGRDFESSMALAEEFWTEYSRLVLEGLGLGGDALVELCEAVNSRAWSAECWHPFPETLEALQRLDERGVRMAIVSNFVDTLPGVCARSGIDRFFEVVVASVHAGAMKPDSRIWNVALRRMGVEPEDAWHVGDNYWADVLGARAAGLTPILIDRDGHVPNPDCAAVRSLHELVELVDRVEDDEAAA